MEKDETLKAPKAVLGFRRKTSNVDSCFSQKKNLQRFDMTMNLPQHSKSYRQLSDQMSKTSIQFNHFHIEDIAKEFEEISIKEEIIGILRSYSTFCDSPTLKHPKNLFHSNVNFFERYDSDSDKSIEIIQASLNTIEEAPFLENNLIDYAQDNLTLISVHKTCKKR